MMEAVRTSETSVDTHFTQQYIPEDNSEHSVHFNYNANNEIILRSDCIKDLGVMLGSKLYFHRHIDFVHSQALRTLGLIRYITYNFSSLDFLVILYNSLIRSKLEYASVI
jgi:hypothetical protein